MDTPPAPPEAVLIKLAREAAGIPVSDAAKRAGVSVARWSQIESGSEIRHGRVSPVTGKAGTIARMAHAVPGIGPERLAAEGERPDAAQILGEMMRDEVRVPPPAALAPPSSSRMDPMGIDGGDPALAPYIASVYRDLLEASQAHPEGFTARQAFPDSVTEAAIWADADSRLPDAERRVLLIARMRQLVTQHEKRQRNAGLTGTRR